MGRILTRPCRFRGEHGHPADCREAIATGACAAMVEADAERAGAGGRGALAYAYSHGGPAFRAGAEAAQARMLALRGGAK